MHMFNADTEQHFYSEVKKHIEEVVRDRLGPAVEAVETEIIETAFGETKLTVTIRIRGNQSPRDLKDKFFGLTGRVRSAMGSEMRDVFPVILPVAAYAHA